MIGTTTVTYYNVQSLKSQRRPSYLCTVTYYNATPKYGFQSGLPKYWESGYDSGDDCDSLKSFPSNCTHINILYGIPTDSPINKIEYNNSGIGQPGYSKYGFLPRWPK